MTEAHLGFPSSSMLHARAVLAIILLAGCAEDQHPAMSTPGDLNHSQPSPPIDMALPVDLSIDSPADLTAQVDSVMPPRDLIAVPDMNCSAPGVTTTPANIDFGNVPVFMKSMPQAVVLTGTGIPAAEVQSLHMSGFDKDYFRIVADPTPFMLACGQSMSIAIVFQPLGAGQRTAFLEIGIAGGAATIPLKGVGQ